MNPANTIKQPWLTLVRLATLLFMLACIGWFIAGVVEFLPYAASHPEDFIPYAPTWTPGDFSLILGQFGLSLSIWLKIVLATSIFSALVFWSVGFLIFFRKGKDWSGLYFGAVFVLFGTVSGNPSSAFTGLHPELAWILTPLGVLAWWGLFLQLFLFPNGRFVPRWTRWIALLLLLIYLLVIVFFGGSITPPVPLVLAILAMFGIGAGSQVHRYRRVSTSLERQQTKWVMTALVIAFVMLILSLSPLAFPELITPGSPGNLIAIILSSLPNYFLSIIPLSVGFAIMRYRLWDIDLIIRRTLQYGLLTLLLGLVYFGMVIVLGQVFLAISGQESPLVVVLSTLAIAALFTPLRRRVQVFIDRRFFRQKYDSARALEEFSAAVRREVELEHLTADLARVLHKTVQPNGVSVWIRDSKHKVSEEK